MYECKHKSLNKRQFRIRGKYGNCSRRLLCKMLSPTLDALADEYEGQITVGKLNIDNAQNIAAKYGVMSIPTVILFKNGIAVDKKIGVSPKPVYVKMIDSAAQG